MYPNLTTTIANLNEEDISSERKEKLKILIKYIQSQRDQNKTINLNFICTHNSRRSHLCQVWAKTLAAYYSVDNVRCFSGGTEATAVYPLIVNTLQNTGFIIDKINEDKNPTYKLSFEEEKCPMTLCSKRFDDTYNPKDDFAAVMTCNDADVNCPIIPNAKRISLPYIDPKISDNTPEQANVYADRSVQIATEMKYVFSHIK